MIDHATDATLLRRFAEGREESAFAELVDRHGPSVDRVCRRFLRNEHDVEEVFQASFFVLAQRASDVAWQPSVGAWVQDVARRLALRARSKAARRRRHEVHASSLCDGWLGDECPAAVFSDEVERRESRGLIDRAVDGLPEKYRAPIVLCYLEGLTNNEAAAQLGYPVGSMSRRLERARGLLRRQLVGQGLTLILVVGLAVLGALAMWTTPNRVVRESRPLQDAMALLQSETSPQFDLRELIAALERTDGDGLGVADRDRLERLAEQSTWVAETITPLKSGAGRAAWRAYAVEMKLAALELSRATENGREPELLASVRRLNATCVQCHTTFH